MLRLPASLVAISWTVFLIPSILGIEPVSAEARADAASAVRPAADGAARAGSGGTTAAVDPVSAALGRSRSALAAHREEAESLREVRARIRALLLGGAPDEAAHLARQTLAGGTDARDTDIGVAAPDPEGLAGAAEAFFAVQDFDALARLVNGWESDGLIDRDPSIRGLYYRWLFTIDDLARVDELTAKWTESEDGHPVDALAAGRLALALLDRDRAESHYQRALERSREPLTRAEARRGLGSVALKRLRYDDALSHFLAAHADKPLDPDLLTGLAETLIRLGRTEEAIRALEMAVRAAPYHELAHYYLGNGYAEKNYTQLYAAYPQAFGGSESTEGSGHAGRTESTGASDDARGRESTGGTESTGGPDGARGPRGADGPAEIAVRAGSRAFGEGDLVAARAYFLEALAQCPEYGRAHNGLAKTLEMERLRIEVHRERYEADFAALEFPAVRGIERFVVNWGDLEPRHQKMVALAVVPWARYVPVLIEGGQTYYIKPLHELLSETPGQETLRDLRIDYDSRLWDDVRGCGGFHTVTGIEDVERTILGRYNTVLHELTHQVHAVLTADRKREIQELYRAAKVRDDATDEGFLSRYAGGSIWEYFAEGANALESPRRDAYDTREIVRERLDAIDPPLRDLVVELMDDADVESTYAVAYANRGDDRLQRGKALDAIEDYHLALSRAPQEESALGSLVYALLAADSLEEAVRWAEIAVERQPSSGALASSRAMALWHGGEGLERAVEAAGGALTRVRTEDRAALLRALGRMAVIHGDAERATSAYREALTFQEDDPEALWGLAAARALHGDFEAAWPLYERAVELRTGIVELRNAFAFDLLRAGEVPRARAQVEAALLLDAEDGDALALRGWIELAEGRAGDAEQSATVALSRAPWCDLAQVIAARAALSRGDAETARARLKALRERIASQSPPDLVYREKWGRFDEVHTLPATLRTLVAELP